MKCIYCGIDGVHEGTRRCSNSIACDLRMAQAENARLSEALIDLRACNEAMREPMRKLRDLMGMPAQGEDAVADAVCREVIRVREALESGARTDAHSEEHERAVAAFCRVVIAANPTIRARGGK